MGFAGPARGLSREGKLARQRVGLIQSVPALIARVRAESHEQVPRTPEHSAKQKLARVVAEIRRISQEIGPVRNF